MGQIASQLDAERVPFRSPLASARWRPRGRAVLRWPPCACLSTPGLALASSPSGDTSRPSPGAEAGAVRPRSRAEPAALFGGHPAPWCVAEADREEPESRRHRRPVRRCVEPSTIYGNGKRGTGILNNELYIGRLVWNRLRYVKNPDTGKRVSRLNPEAEWMRKEVPELRIVSDDLWTAAKSRQQQTSAGERRPGRVAIMRRTRHLPGTRAVRPDERDIGIGRERPPPTGPWGEEGGGWKRGSLTPRLSPNSDAETGTDKNAGGIERRPWHRAKCNIDSEFQSAARALRRTPARVSRRTNLIRIGGTVLPRLCSPSFSCFCGFRRRPSAARGLLSGASLAARGPRNVLSGEQLHCRHLGVPKGAGQEPRADCHRTGFGV
jgi:hypothetical protein